MCRALEKTGQERARLPDACPGGDRKARPSVTRKNASCSVTCAKVTHGFTCTGPPNGLPAGRPTVVSRWATQTGLCGSGEHRGKRDARALSAQLRCGVHGQRPFNSGLTEHWLTEQCCRKPASICGCNSSSLWNRQSSRPVIYSQKTRLAVRRCVRSHT